MKRRKFIQSATVAASTPFILRQTAPGKLSSKDGGETTILLQGDSITDAGRDKKNTNPNDVKAMGAGYAFLTATQLLERYPALRPRIYNRGISGNKVHQLAERWEEDALDIRPDVMSILVGVNDHWHTLGGNYDGTPQVYRRDYDALLERTMKKLPSLRLMICEPFILTDVEKIKKEEWIPVFDEYRQIARDLAQKYEAVFIPYQTIFENALLKAPAEYWAPDGVHPSLAGAQLMADHWIAGFDQLRSL